MRTSGCAFRSLPVAFAEPKTTLLGADLQTVELNGIEPSASSMPFRGEVKKNQ